MVSWLKWQWTTPKNNFPSFISGYEIARDGFFYKYHHTEKRTWLGALSTCKSEGGSLAVIPNFATREVAHGLMRKGGWIGLTDRWQELKWQTPDRKDATYFAWSQGQPDIWIKEEDCVEVMQWNKRWNDLRCNRERPFLCQISSGKFTIRIWIACNCQNFPIWLKKCRLRLAFKLAL